MKDAMKNRGITAALLMAAVLPFVLAGCSNPITPPPPVQEEAAEAASAREQFAPYTVSVRLAGDEAERSGRSVAGPTMDRINADDIRNYIQVIAVDKADGKIAAFAEVRRSGVSHTLPTFILTGLVNEHTYGILFLQGHWERDYAKETGGNYAYTNNPPTLLSVGYEDVTFLGGGVVTISVWPIFMDTVFTTRDGGLTVEPVVKAGKPGAVDLPASPWTVKWRIVRGESGKTNGLEDLLKAQKAAFMTWDNILIRDLTAVVRLDGNNPVSSASRPTLTGYTVTLPLDVNFTALSRVRKEGAVNFALSFVPFNLKEGWAAYDKFSVFDLEKGLPEWVIRNGLNDLPQNDKTDFEKFGTVPITEANGNGAVRFNVVDPLPAKAGELAATNGSWAASSITFTASGYTGTAQVWYATGLAPPSYDSYSLLEEVPAGTYTKITRPLGMFDAFVLLVKDGKVGELLWINHDTDFRLPTVADVRLYLDSLTEAGNSRGTSADDPILLPMVTNLANSADSLTNLLSLIAEKKKYVSLNLSLCTLSGTEFNPNPSSSTGKNLVVSLTLPNSAQSIPPGNPAFKYFTNLNVVSSRADRISIGNNAFQGCTRLTVAEFPNATAIGNSAFQDCSALTAANFPKATAIGNNAFQGCAAMTTANLSAAASIGNNAFQGCAVLTAANIPKATTIGDYAFQGCAALTAADFPAAATVGVRVFNQCAALKTVNLPKAPAISAYAFQGCAALTTANLPATTSLGDHAFQGCTALTTVTARKVTSIESFTFQSTALTEANFPEATYIGRYAFYECKSLTKASFPKVVNVYGQNAFGFCTALKTVSLPKATFLGAATFHACTALTEVDLSSIEKIDFSAFFMTGPVTIVITMPFQAPEVRNGGTYCEGIYSKTVIIKRPRGGNSYNEIQGNYDTWPEYNGSLPWKTYFENLFGFDALIAVTVVDR
jgi:hypothetical protein